MESLKRKEKTEQEVELLVSNILDKEREFEGNQDQKIAFLSYSYYESLGEDELINMMKNSSSVFRYVSRGLDEKGIKDSDIDYSEKFEEEKKKVIGLHKELGNINFLKEMFKAVPQVSEEEDEEDNKTGIISYNFNTPKDGERSRNSSVSEKFKSWARGFSITKISFVVV